MFEVPLALAAERNPSSVIGQAGLWGEAPLTGFRLTGCSVNSEHATADSRCHAHLPAYPTPSDSLPL
jgi:hypothetical protein